MLYVYITAAYRFQAHGYRALVGAAVLLVGVVPAQGASKTWTPTGTQSFWSIESAWSPTGVPQEMDEVYVPGGKLLMLDQHTGFLGEAEIAEGSAVFTNGFVLNVDPHQSGRTGVIGEDSMLVINPHNVLPTFPAFSTHTLDLDVGRLYMQGGLALVQSRLNNGGDIRGHGTLRVIGTANPKLTNDGIIAAEGGTLEILSIDGGTIDLDGDEDAGQLHAIDGSSTLTVDGRLYDPFEGYVLVSAGNTINFTQAFENTHQGLFFIEAEGGVGTLNFADFQNHGLLQVLSGRAEVYADSIDLREDSYVQVADGAELLFGRAASNDGIIFLAGGEVTGETIHNATDGTIVGVGAVTTYDINNNGTIQAYGGELVIDTVRTHASLDGTNHTGTLDVRDGDMTIHFGVSSGGGFHGTIRIGPGRTLHTVNHAYTLQENATMYMEGGTYLGQGFGQATDGGALYVFGAEPSRIIARNGASSFFYFTQLDAPLWLSEGSHHVNPSAIFQGPGAVIIDSDARFGCGSAVMGVDVINHGRLSPGSSIVDSARDLTVRSLELAPAGTLVIDLGGTAPEDFDRISIANGEAASLGGTLQVQLINNFMPVAGDSFEVLTAGEIVGAFDEITGDVYQVADDVALVPVVDKEAETKEALMLYAVVPGDLNLDTVVDMRDFAAMQIGFQTGDEWADGDIDGDGTVTLDDYVIFMTNQLLQPLR